MIYPMIFRKISACIWGLAYVLLAVAPQVYGQDTTITAFVKVSVIPMNVERVIPGQTVIISDGRIVTIGDVDDIEIPDNAQLISGNGRFLVPGLADIHVHTTEKDLSLFLANGVTTILSMHGGPDHLAWRDQVRSGTLLGPTIITTGPLVTGRPIHWPHVVAETPSDARRVVEQQAAAGYDFVKVYDFLSRETYDALVKTADSLGIAFLGHAPVDVGLERVLEVGQRSIEHVDQIIYALYGREQSMEIPEARIPEAVTLMVKYKTRLTPTLAGMKIIMQRGSDWFESLFERPEMAYVAPGNREWWNSLRGGNPSEDTRKRRLHFLHFQQALAKTLHKAGVKILVGTDTPNGLLVPGFSIHDELQTLVEDIGFTPFEAIRAATYYAAEFLGEFDEFGTISVGSRADLVLVDRNPLEDIRHLQKPLGVMVRGRWLPRERLGQMLTEVAASFSN